MNTLNPIQYADAPGYSTWFNFFTLTQILDDDLTVQHTKLPKNDHSLLTIFLNSQNFLSYKSIFINNKRTVFQWNNVSLLTPSSRFQCILQNKVNGNERYKVSFIELSIFKIALWSYSPIFHLVSSAQFVRRWYDVLGEKESAWWVLSQF